MNAEPPSQPHGEYAGGKVAITSDSTLVNCTHTATHGRGEFSVRCTADELARAMHDEAEAQRLFGISCADVRTLVDTGRRHR